MSRTSTDHPQSRAILAGDDPARLQAAHVLVAGAGALGQNVLQNLALAGVGYLTVVDFDEFEAHNATRSPLFPRVDEVEVHGLGKAVNVAHRVANISTAADVVVRWASEPVQSAGDGLITAADVVASCVDDLAARAWLAERCRVRRRPMVEGGFRASEYTLSGFGPGDGEVCYRCANPADEGLFSYRRYAAAAQEAGIVPAIQTTAAVLGGLQAEQVVQWLHGGPVLRNQRIYGSLHTHRTDLVWLPVDADCPGIHATPLRRIALPLAGEPTLGDLLGALRDAVGSCTVELAEPLVLSTTCQHAECGRGVRVRSTRATWLRSPYCSRHGGSWEDGPAFAEEIQFVHTHARAVDDDGVLLAALGMAGGAAVVVHPDDDAAVLVELPGGLDDVTSRVSLRG